MNARILRTAILVALGLSATAQAATVVTGGRCTQKQMSNKLTKCETSSFTNTAGQTGYKCTCTDRMVVLNPDRAGDVRAQHAPDARVR